MTDRNTPTPGRSLWAQRAQEVPGLRDVLSRYRWHLTAACKDGEVDFFHEPGSSRADLTSPVALLPLLLCQRCPVRSTCLAEALTPWRYQHAVEDSVPVIVMAAGTWGGTTDADRTAVKKLPVAEAHALLEAGLDQRIALRIAAWKKQAATRDRPTKTGGTWHTRFDRAVMKLLAERESGGVAFTLGGLGGPGRGHRGPAYAYAQEHRCSMTTARIRLRQAA